MEEPAEPTEETKHSRGFGRYVFWAGVVLLLYVLSSGPAVMMEEKGVWAKGSSWDRFSEIVYAPLIWAYVDTPLRKPLGMYFHLWSPQSFDKKGQFRPPPCAG